MRKASKAYNLLVLTFGLWLLSAAVVHAALATIYETIPIEEEQYNIQIIIQGDEGKPFEADLEMPDGTRFKHGQYDASKVLYLEMADSERRWLINVAPKGDYKLHISGETQGYQISLKRELRKPNTEWVSPTNTVIQASKGELSLKWNPQGDYGNTDFIRFYLKPAEGWTNMLIGEASLGSGQFNVILPDTVTDGEYDLHVIADNKTAEGQAIDPKVKILVSRGFDQAAVSVIHVIPEGEEVSIEIETPIEFAFNEVNAEFKDQAGVLIERKSALADLYVLEQTEASDTRRYRWTLALPEGIYQGKMQLGYANNTMSNVAEIPDFELRIRDWSKDKVEWSIESEKTNVEQLQVTLTLQAKTHVQIIDSAEGILYDSAMAASDENNNRETITVPLTEGDHFIELLLKDTGGAMNSYHKRYLIDRNPPQLAMIQPQANHTKLSDGIASGFTDTDSVVIYKGVEYAVDQAGYFSIQDIGSSLHLTVRDSHGNETSYYWEEGRSWSRVKITFIIINSLLVITTVVVIYFIRRRSKEKASGVTTT